MKSTTKGKPRNRNFLLNENGDIQMIQAALAVIVLLVVLYVGIMINQSVITSTEMIDSETATGVLEYSGVGLADEVIVIGTETYTLKAIASGAFEVTIGSTESITMFNLETEVNTNSTLVSADNVAGGTTIFTALTPGAAGNYATTTDVTGWSWRDTTMSGGVDGDELYTASTTMNDVAESSYSMAGILPIVMIAVAILGSLLGIFYLFR